MYDKFWIILGLCAFQACAQIGQPFVEHSAEQSVELINKKIVAGPKLFAIEGTIMPAGPELRTSSQWPADITLSINGGEYQGFVRQDGSFVISGVPPGSYVLYADHADIYFKPIRVEIAQNGKLRARKLSNIKPTQVVKLPYPLMLSPVTRRKYFHSREQWNVLDYVLSPMVLLMVVPLMLMLLLPRIINDPETKREIENIQFPKIPTGVPDLSDVLTSLLNCKRPPENDKKAVAIIANKRRN